MPFEKLFRVVLMNGTGQIEQSLLCYKKKIGMVVEGKEKKQYKQIEARTLLHGKTCKTA